jgi:hypothetical protein
MEVRLMWLPRSTFATLRNAVVVSVAGGKATVAIDGGDAAGLPVYGGTPKAGDKVLVAVQGDQMLVLGAGLGQTVTPFTYRGGLGDFGEGNQGAVVIKTGRLVTVAGVARNGSGATIAAGTVVGSMPPGHAPAAVSPAFSQGSAGTVRMDVQPDGAVTLVGQALAPFDWVALDIRYLAAN